MARVALDQPAMKTGLWTMEQFVWPHQDAKQLFADIMGRKLWGLVSEQGLRFGVRAGQLIELPTAAWLSQAERTYEDAQRWRQTFLLWYLDYEDCPVGEYCVLPTSIPVRIKTYQIAVLKSETYARLYGDAKLDGVVRPTEPDMETRIFDRRQVRMGYEVYDLWQRAG